MPINISNKSTVNYNVIIKIFYKTLKVDTCSFKLLSFHSIMEALYFPCFSQFIAAKIIKCIYNLEVISVTQSKRLRLK